MLTLVTAVVVMAIGAALSPTLFVTSELLLTSKVRPRAKALAFAGGAWLAFAIMAVLVFTAVAPALIDGVTSTTAVTAAVDLVLGSVLVALAGYFRFRAASGFQTHEERTGRPPDDSSVRRWALVGLVLTARDVSTMILYYDALEHIAVSTVDVGSKGALTAIVFAVASVPVWIPLAVHITIPDSLFHRVEQLKEWVLRHRRTIRVTICLVFGLYLVARGLFELRAL
ncbi:MAG: GAP family protein [Actinobacteria bacterium]|nr:GAP family protein [Actinomycetota bacterium]